ncbi:MAG: SWIM zinc finger family protein, partial [Spirochaetota bacterium]
MLLFDERTIGRGIDYYLNGHVLDVRPEGARLTAAVAGTRAKPYTVVVDTERFERSRCTCPVGYACKHLAAVVLSISNDEQAQPALRARATRFARASRLLAEFDAAVDDMPGSGHGEPDLAARDRAHFTFDLEAEIRAAGQRRPAEIGEPEIGGHGESVPRASARYRESIEEGGWRLALLIDVDAARRPQVSLVRQYRRRDGAYGRVEVYRSPEAVFVPNAAARKLAERLRVLGGVAPVVAFAREIAATKLPIFAGSGSLLSGVQNAPVKVIRPSRFDLEVVPVAEQRSFEGRRR